MKRLTIGVLADSTTSHYHHHILSGIEDFALKNDINIFYFIIGTVNINMEKPLLPIHLFINKNLLDGVIVLSPTLCWFLNYKDICDLNTLLLSIPSVSIDNYIKGISSICIENSKAMKEMIIHLIEKHNYKRFAYIRGMRNVQDEVLRFTAFTETLAQYEIPLDESLVVQASDFGIGPGRQAMEILLESKKGEFEVVVCANDDLAYGALKTLSEQNIKVPEQVAVVGYDDMYPTKANSPGLTTIGQPFFNQGKQAAKLVYEKINGKIIPFENILSSRLIIRESCGCNQIPKKADYTFNSDKKESVRDLINTSLVEKMNSWLDERDTNALLTLFSRLIDQILSKNEENRETAFLEAWQNILDFAKEKRVNTLLLGNSLTDIKNKTVNTFSDVLQIKKLYYLFNQAELLLSLETKENAVYFSARVNALDYNLHQFDQKLLIAKDIEKQMNVLDDYLPALKIKSSYICLYLNGETNINKCRLYFAYNKGKRIISEANASFPLFSTSEMIPPEYREWSERISLVIEPLSYGYDRLGYSIFELKEWENTKFDIIASFLSSSIKNSILFKEIKTLTLSMEQLVSNRTKDLSRSNAQLKQQLDKLQDIVSRMYNSPTRETQENMKINKALDYIHHNFNDPELSLEEVARHVNSETTYFSKQFKENTGNGFKKYLTDLRIDKSKILLQNTKLSIKEIANMIGYYDEKYFYKLFKKHVMCSPGKFRNKIST